MKSFLKYCSLILPLFLFIAVIAFIVNRDLIGSIYCFSFFAVLLTLTLFQLLYRFKNEKTPLVLNIIKNNTALIFFVLLYFSDYFFVGATYNPSLSLPLFAIITIVPLSFIENITFNLDFFKKHILKYSPLFLPITLIPCFVAILAMQYISPIFYICIFVVLLVLGVLQTFVFNHLKNKGILTAISIIKHSANLLITSYFIFISFSLKSNNFLLIVYDVFAVLTVLLFLPLSIIEIKSKS